MILHLVKCEMCDKQYAFNPAVHPARREAPDGWLVLFPAHDMQGSDGWHFCSPECLCHWSEVNLAIKDSQSAESPFIRREDMPDEVA